MYKFLIKILKIYSFIFQQLTLEPTFLRFKGLAFMVLSFLLRNVCFFSGCFF